MAEKKRRRAPSKVLEVTSNLMLTGVPKKFSKGGHQWQRVSQHLLRKRAVDAVKKLHNQGYIARVFRIESSREDGWWIAAIRLKNN